MYFVTLNQILHPVINFVTHLYFSSMPFFLTPFLVLLSFISADGDLWEPSARDDSMGIMVINVGIMVAVMVVEVMVVGDGGDGLVVVVIVVRDGKDGWS